MNRISATIPNQLNICRFVNQSIQPLLEEAKAQKVFVDSKDWNGLTLHGRLEVINPVQEKINTFIKDIRQNTVTSRLKLSFIESELIRANLYEVTKRVERETNIVITDVKINASGSSTSDVSDSDVSLRITCVVNDRGQTILVKKSDIKKVKDVDAIINAANGPLHHVGGIDKVIGVAAGPELDQEC